MNKLKLRSAGDQVFDYLLRAIFNGELKSGQKLVIETIARELGTSATPVRDAFKKMELQGLLDVRPRSGSYVKMPTAKEIEDVFQLRLILEQAALNGRADFPAADLAPISRALDRAELSDDTADYIAADELLHETIMNRLDNNEIFNLTRVIWIKMMLFRIVCGRDKTFDRAALAEHRSMVKAMADGDGPALAELDRVHILAVQEQTVASFNKLR